MSYDAYKAMTDKQHLNKTKTMPIRYLKNSGKGFFVEKDGYALAVREDLREVVNTSAIAQHMKDILNIEQLNITEEGTRIASLLQRRCKDHVQY